MPSSVTRAVAMHCQRAYPYDTLYEKGSVFAELSFELASFNFGIFVSNFNQIFVRYL